MDDWQREVQFSKNLIHEGLLLGVPSCTIDEQSIDIDPVFRRGGELFLVHLQDFELEIEGVDRKHIGSGMGLQDSSEETLWEVESTHPVAMRGLVIQTSFDEVDSGDHVFVPGCEGFQG